MSLHHTSFQRMGTQRTGEWEQIQEPGAHPIPHYELYPTSRKLIDLSKKTFISLQAPCNFNYKAWPKITTGLILQIAFFLDMISMS